jgi:hypothetical protein
MAGSFLRGLVQLQHPATVWSLPALSPHVVSKIRGSFLDANEG